MLDKIRQMLKINTKKKEIIDNPILEKYYKEVKIQADFEGSKSVDSLNNRKGRSDHYYEDYKKNFDGSFKDYLDVINKKEKALLAIKFNQAVTTFCIKYSEIQVINKNPNIDTFSEEFIKQLGIERELLNSRLKKREIINYEKVIIASRAVSIYFEDEEKDLDILVDICMQAREYELKKRYGIAELL